jgi:hypothetical protein
MEISPISVLNNICPKYICYTSVQQTAQGKRLMLNVSSVDELDWIYETGCYKDQTKEVIEKQYLASLGKRAANDSVVHLEDQYSIRTQLTRQNNRFKKSTTEVPVKKSEGTGVKKLVGLSFEDESY